MARIHPGAPMLLEERGEFGLALPCGASQVGTKIGVAERCTPHGGIAWNGHRILSDVKHTETSPDRSTGCFSFWGGGQVVQRKGIAKAYGYLKQGALGADRSPRMEIAPALAELPPAVVGVDVMVRYGLREELDSRPCMVLQRHTRHHNRCGAEMLGNPAHPCQLRRQDFTTVGLPVELDCQRIAEPRFRAIILEDVGGDGRGEIG